jgi:hypothetical protein
MPSSVQVFKCAGAQASATNEGDRLSRHSFATRWIGIGGACLFGLVIVARCGSRERPAANLVAKKRLNGRDGAPAFHDRAPVPAHGRPAVTEGRVAEDTPGHPLSAAAEAVQATEVEQHLRSTVAVISMPPADRAKYGSLGAPQPLSPELDRQRRVAMDSWKREAQQLLNECVRRPEQARRLTALQVFFAPMPRAPAERQQVLTPSWIAMPPQDQQRLWQDTTATELERCLGRLRSVAITVPLAGEALAHEFPSSAESVLVQL